MASDIAFAEAPTVALQTHVLGLRGGRIEVVGEPASVAVGVDPLLIGRSKRCALVLDDPAVTKMHLEVRATPRGVRVVDLNSTNGTFIGDAALGEVYLNRPCTFRCGAKHLRFVPEPVREVQITAPERFGGLFGRAPEMTQLFAKLQRYAPRSMSMLIQGESGTGKELVAHAIHEASPRRDKRFVPVNCAGVRDNLLESELFGCVRGAFTGADRNRDGLFVVADGGTLFFDEVGEMSLAMQATLLRVLEHGEVRPVGAACCRKVDVRTLFATHVDLCKAMNDGRFREDLYYRIVEFTVEIPPLRRRLEDLPTLVDDLLVQLGYPDLTVDEAGLAALRARRWRGNVTRAPNSSK